MVKVCMPAMTLCSLAGSLGVRRLEGLPAGLDGGDKEMDNPLGFCSLGACLDD